MQKKSGFTLVEIIVVIAISAIVLTMVGTTMVFMTNVSGNLLEEAEDIDMAKNIEKYLRSFVGTNNVITKDISINIFNKPSNDSFSIDQQGNILETNTNKTIFSETRLYNFSITPNEEGFVVCYMKFFSGKEFEFILGIVETANNEENTEGQ